MLQVRILTNQLCCQAILYIQDRHYVTWHWFSLFPYYVDVENINWSCITCFWNTFAVAHKHINVILYLFRSYIFGTKIVVVSYPFVLCFPSTTGQHGNTNTTMLCMFWVFQGHCRSYISAYKKSFYPVRLSPTLPKGRVIQIYKKVRQLDLFLLCYVDNYGNNHKDKMYDYIWKKRPPIQI